MQQNFKQLDLQALINLLSIETKKCTDAFNNGNQKGVEVQTEIIDILIDEILSRKLYEKDGDILETSLN
jgi:hypothetical protein